MLFSVSSLSNVIISRGLLIICLIVSWAQEQFLDKDYYIFPNGIAVVYTIGRNGWSNLDSICSEVELEEGGAVIWFRTWEQEENSHRQVMSVCLITSEALREQAWGVRAVLLVSFLFYELKNLTLPIWLRYSTHRSNLFFHIKYLTHKKKYQGELSWGPGWRDCSLRGDNRYVQTDCFLIPALDGAK